MRDFAFVGARVNGEADVYVREILPNNTMTHQEVTAWVFSGGEKLPPRNDIRNHSPDGFEWGYQGSGPAQLALALCVWVLEAEGNEFPIDRAQRVYQHVKSSLIAGEHLNRWLLSTTDVMASIVEAEEQIGPLPVDVCPYDKTRHPRSVVCPRCLEAATFAGPGAE